MSSTEKYFKFFKNFTRDYSKLVLSSFYKGSLIKDLITEYINIRYYNLYEQKNKNSSKNIQYYMELKCKKLTDIYDKDMISKSLYFICISYNICVRCNFYCTICKFNQFDFTTQLM